MTVASELANSAGDGDKATSKVYKNTQDYIGQFFGGSLVEIGQILDQLSDLCRTESPVLALEVSCDLGPIRSAPKIETDQIQVAFEEAGNYFRPRTSPMRSTSLRRNYERYQYLLDQFQEQPHLLSPHVEPMLARFLDMTASTDSVLRYEGFRYLCHFVKVRGHKIIMRFLPHEVKNVEPVLSQLEAEAPGQNDHWERRYMLLIWLAMIAKIPFDMSRFGGGAGQNRPGLMERILAVGRPYLAYSNKCREAAAFLLAAVLARPDAKAVREAEVESWLETLKERLSATDKGLHAAAEWHATGIALGLAYLFKTGRREDLLPMAPKLVAYLVASPLLECRNMQLRKLTAKLLQRVALSYLKAKPVAWRYERGVRRLADNLGPSGDPATAVEANTESPRSDSPDLDVPPDVEQILGLLLQSLQDSDGVVRWSAAKGIGRLIGRLSRPYADQLVDWLLQLFKDENNENGWHGGCLALAELARRGLLLPARLPDVVPVIQKALCFDQMRGKCSVGSGIRDSACYVCWSFGRAFMPADLEPFVNQIAPSLICMALFDREITCRRAAAAAFQENVGRQSVFPYGIEITGLVDFFAVSNRSACYGDLCKAVAKFSDYTKPLIDHLVEHKVGHWDEEIRILTASALGVLSPIAPNYISYEVLPAIKNLIYSGDLFSKQGAMFAVSEIVQALDEMVSKSGLADENLDSYLGDEMSAEMWEIPERLEQTVGFKGVTGEYLRKAVNCYISHICACAKLSPKSEKFAPWKRLLDDNVQNSVESVRNGAASAMGALLSFFDGNPEISASYGVIVKEYLTLMRETPYENTRMGAASVLAAMPSSVIGQWSRDILTSLIACTAPSSEQDKLWAESRRESLNAISTLCAKISFEADKDIPADLFQTVWDALIIASDDYTIDSRGDIGVIVREAAVCGLKIVMLKAACENPTALDGDAICCAIGKILQQCCEKVDATRAVAADVITTLLHHESLTVLHIIHREALAKIFPPEGLEEGQPVKWVLGSFAFPRLAPLLDFPEYLQPVLLGFISSAGDLTESVMRAASDAFMNYVAEIRENRPEMDLLLETLTRIFENYAKQSRVVIPLMRLLNTMLTCGYLDLYTDYEGDSRLIMQLLDCTVKEMMKCKNVAKVLCGLDVCSGMLQFSGPIGERAMKVLLRRLVHSFPRVRKKAAESLYEALLTFGLVNLDNHSEHILPLLEGTDWLGQVEELRLVQTEIAGTLGLEL